MFVPIVPGGPFICAPFSCLILRKKVSRGSQKSYPLLEINLRDGKWRHKFELNSCQSYSKVSTITVYPSFVRHDRKTSLVGVINSAVRELELFKHHLKEFVDCWSHSWHSFLWEGTGSLDHLHLTHSSSPLFEPSGKFLSFVYHASFAYGYLLGTSHERERC